MSEVTQSKVLTMSEIDLIQNEIETYTKKIEHEKINLRLTTERYEKQMSQYLQLQGLPVPFKTKEQKEKEKKEKTERKRQKKPLYESKPKMSKVEVLKQNPNMMIREISKNETELDKVIEIF
jgi:hypothetical protein